MVYLIKPFPVTVWSVLKDKFTQKWKFSNHLVILILMVNLSWLSLSIRVNLSFNTVFADNLNSQMMLNPKNFMEGVKIICTLVFVCLFVCFTHISKIWTGSRVDNGSVMESCNQLRNHQDLIALLWNKLPEELRLETVLTTVKSRLKTLLFTGVSLSYCFYSACFCCLLLIVFIFLFLCFRPCYLWSTLCCLWVEMCCRNKCALAPFSSVGRAGVPCTEHLSSL